MQLDFAEALCDQNPALARVAKNKGESLTLWREIMKSRGGRISRIFGGPPEEEIR